MPHSAGLAQSVDELEAPDIAEAEDREPYSYRSDPAVPDSADDRPVIVFDGHCAFCSGWAGVVLHHDRAGHYRLLRAQSGLGAALYRHYGLDPVDYQTNILLAEGRVWLKSEDSIRMAERLSLPWLLAGALRLMPRRLRDALYEVVARNRFRIAGRREVCYAPPEDMRERFLG